ncbi:MAG: PAS domain S-box protein, partial [Syntrophales bacterium]|nr:PAS domain S-box protein [Syntrophales bacterium]
DVQVVVSSGEAAFKQAQELCPDLVLMDMALEGEMDGVEAAGQIHAQLDSPVVYVTADISKARIEEIKRTQPFGCVFKPFKDVELQAAVEIALNKHTENENLRESEEKYRAIIEGIEDGYYEVDLAGRFTFFNQAMCTLANVPAEELLGMNDLEYTDPETAKKIYKTFNEVYRTGKSAEVGDYEIIRKDDSRKTVEFNVSLIRDKNAQPVGFRGIVRDVTKRWAMEAALRESEESYRNVLDLAPDAITVVRARDGVHLQVNDAICQQTGYTADEIIGRTDSELNLYVDRADRRRLYSTLAQEGRVDGLEIRYRAKDGTILDDLVSARTIRFRGEDCFLFVATVITSLKKAEQALRQSEEKYRRILEETEDGYWEVDLKGRFTFFNDALCRMVGVPAEEFNGMYSLEHSPFEAAKEIYTIFNEVYRTGRPANIADYELIKLDGSRAIHELSVSLIRDEEGNPAGFRGVSRDITPRKQAEEEAHAHREHLALINRILRHDLTNDLVVIQGALDLYARSPEENLLTEASGRVKKSLDLITRMRGLESFISSHKELKAYEMRDVVSEVARDYPSIDFKIKGKARVMADDSLFSVIDNIARNAITHGRADRIEVSIDRREEMCEVRIADNGSGIPDEIKEKIFEEGFIHGDTGQTGIGLHIVKKAMEKYGGYACAGDNEPNGTVFALKFKMVE